MMDAAIALGVATAIVAIVLVVRALLSGRRIDATAEADFGTERAWAFNRARILAGAVLIVVLAYIVLRLGACLHASVAP
jgi:hypothetical protein